MKSKIIIGLIVFCGLTAFGQSPQNRDEISIWAAGGLSTFNTGKSIGKNTIGTQSLGGYFGLGYNRYFNYNWGLGIGAEFSLLNSETKIPTLTDNYLAPNFNSTVIYRISLEGNDFVQKHSAHYVNIPLSLQYLVDENRHGHRWYVDAGVKAGFSLGGKYKSGGELTTKGWEYEEAEDIINNTPTTNDPYIDMPQHGFSTYQLDSKRSFDLNFNLITSLETGMKWRLSKKGGNHLYTGIFFDYGLLDLRKNKEEKLFERLYNRDENSEWNVIYDLHSIFESRYHSGEFPYDDHTMFRSYVSKVNSIAVGIKLKLTFGWHPFERKKKSGAFEKSDDNLTAEQQREIIGSNIDRLIEANRQAEAERQRQAEEAEKQRQAQEAERLRQAQEAEKQRQAQEAEKQRKAAEEQKSKEQLQQAEEAAVMKAKIEEPIPLHYATAKAMPDNAKEAFDEKLRWLKKYYPNSRIIIEGHTDNTGTRALNTKLGKRRAEGLKDYLVKHGFPASKITTVSKADREPLVPNTSEKNREKNRRLVIKIVK